MNGGEKRTGGLGSDGNVLIQGGYGSTGVTINPAGNISTNGTLTVDGGVSIIDTTTSSSSSSGALTVGGGVGIAGNLNVGGNLVVTGTFTPILYDNMETDITSNISLTSGGCYIVKPSAASTTVSLPTPSTGIRFKFIVQNNSQNVIIESPGESYRGYAFVTDTDNNTTTIYKANGNTPGPSAHDHLNLFSGNAYTGGIIEMTGIDTNYWFVEAKLFTSGIGFSSPWATS